MKRLFTLVLAAIILISGCGKMEEDEIIDLTEESAETTEELSETEDESDNIWSRDDKKEVTIDLDFALESGKPQLYIPEYAADKKMEYRVDGKKLAVINHEIPTFIKEISACDYTFDGVIDLIIVGAYDNGFDTFWLFRGSAPEFDGDVFGFINEDELENSVKKKLAGEYNAEKIKDFLTNGLENGKISSYSEAYKAVINYNEKLLSNGYTYSLIYLDEDDIPELVADASGYYLSVYSFSNGTVKEPMVTCAYGVGGCVAYEYAPYKNSIRVFGHDTDEYYNQLYTIKDNKLLSAYERISYYDSDKVEYNNYTDEQLTDAELEAKFKDLDSYDYEDLSGEQSAGEMLVSLE